jgi:HK97 family phage prohead protease
MSELEFRSAEVADVNYKQRMIELIVMPYEQPTMIHTPARSFEEVVSRGAFDGVEKRTSQVKVNLDHQVQVLSTIGRAVALHPARPEGLVAELKISRTPAGNDALELAADGSLGASAGFRLLQDPATGKVKPDAEVWETQTRRRLNHLFLHHVAMTPDPAYAGAEVLSVRTAEAPQDGPGRDATPNLDRLELERQRALYAELDSRYGLTR